MGTDTVLWVMTSPLERRVAHASMTYSAGTQRMLHASNTGWIFKIGKIHKNISIVIVGRCRKNMQQLRQSKEQATYNILKYMVCGPTTNSIKLSYDVRKWWAVINNVIKLGLQKKADNFSLYFLKHWRKILKNSMSLFGRRIWAVY